MDSKYCKCIVFHFQTKIETKKAKEYLHKKISVYFADFDDRDDLAP